MTSPTWCCAALALAIAAGSLGCGSKDSNGKAKGGGAGALASCNTTVGECSEYDQGNRALGDDHLKKLCDNFQGTFATTGCPATNRIGSCSKDEGTKVYYQGYPITAADLERGCTESAGKWRTP